jgi:hypothetical protein
MDILGGTKIQSLMNFPKGIVLTSDFLKVNGFSAQLLAQYKRSHWLELIGGGAYKRRNEVVDWRGALAAMQGQLNLPMLSLPRAMFTFLAAPDKNFPGGLKSMAGMLILYIR